MPAMKTPNHGAGAIPRRRTAAFAVSSPASVLTRCRDLPAHYAAATPSSRSSAFAPAPRRVLVAPHTRLHSARRRAVVAASGDAPLSDDAPNAVPNSSDNADGNADAAPALRAETDAAMAATTAAAADVAVPSAAEGEGEDGDNVRQLLGMKGASATTNKWRIRLQLMKPVTWIPLIWGVTCGAAASGNFHWDRPVQIAQSLTCMFLAGPLLTGYTQVLNDWYDRDLDAINEPYRPIPAGLVTEQDVKAQLAALLVAGIAVSYGLDVWAGHEWPINTALSIFGSFISYIYSAPPLKLKQNGWLGSYALGASYISLPWWAGQALFGQLDWKVMVLTLFYSWAGLGIAIVNDFKSVEGDRALGMKSLPVMFGIDVAKWICVGTIDIFQLLVAAVLYAEGEANYAAAIVALVLPQMFLQGKYFLKDPVKYDVKYQGAAQPFLVIGILVAGLAVGHHGPL